MSIDMGLITAIFATNWIALYSAAIIDRRLLNDSIEDHKYLWVLFGAWTLLSFATIPIYLILLVWEIFV